MKYGVITVYLNGFSKMLPLYPDTTFLEAVELFDMAKQFCDRVVLSIRENGGIRRVAEWRVDT